ncbi:MAG: hypothetical protein ACK42H_05990 [Planctomycetota bacterium]
MSPNIFGARATRDEALREDPPKRFREDIAEPDLADVAGVRIKGLLVPALTLLVGGDDSCGVGRNDNGPWAFTSTSEILSKAKIQLSPSASLPRFPNMASYSF